MVGAVAAAGDGVAPGFVGTRVAALLKVGGWVSHVVVDAADVVPVLDGIDAAEAETAATACPAFYCAPGRGPPAVVSGTVAWLPWSSGVVPVKPLRVISPQTGVPLRSDAHHPCSRHRAVIWR